MKTFKYLGSLLTNPGAIAILSRWEQFNSNLLNVKQSTNLEGSEIYNEESDISELSLVEVELAVENLRKCKAPGVDHIPSELIQSGVDTKSFINLLQLFGTEKKCHKNGKNPLVTYNLILSPSVSLTVEFTALYCSFYKCPTSWRTFLFYDIYL